jgi:lipopolysaccharide/colanic/teichoic acid biosynthesis glycosyltransferase
MDLDTTEQLRMWTVVDGHRRILNVIVAVAGILLLMPLMVLIVIAIRLT